MRIYGWSLAAMFSVVSCGVAAQTASGTGFDCTKAHTRVERVLCGYADSQTGWLDRTMSELYHALLSRPEGDATALSLSQRKWLARRNRCSGNDVAIMNCLSSRYGERFAEITAPYDTGRLTGTYWNRDAGSIDVVLFPDHSIAVNADAQLGEPSYNSCNLSFHGKLAVGLLDYTFPKDQEDDSSEPSCRIRMTQVSTGFRVYTEHCDLKCGNGVHLDGTYTR